MLITVVHNHIYSIKKRRKYVKQNDVIHNIYPDLFHYQFIYTNVETVFLSCLHSCIGDGPKYESSTGKKMRPWEAPIKTKPKSIRKKYIWNICELVKTRTITPMKFVTWIPENKIFPIWIRAWCDLKYYNMYKWEFTWSHVKCFNNSIIQQSVLPVYPSVSY